MIEKQVGADNLACVVIEPIQGEGGFVVPAPGFLPRLRGLVRATTACVFVADEIQTGFCRTGDWFACDHEGVVPDLVTTAKGIAGGLPLAAVTGRAELMDAVHVGGLGGTYGGNPVACAAALGAIEEMRDPRPRRPRPRRSATIMHERLTRARRRAPGDRRRPRPRRDDGDRARASPGTTDAGPGARRRGLGVLPPDGRGHADLRHLGQRVPVPATARRSPTRCSTRRSTSWPRRSAAA